MKKTNWLRWAVEQIERDFNRSSDTHLIKLELPILARNDIDVYLKDESTHPTQSLKHRLARSLFLYGLCNGWILNNTPIIESSSGSTAVSEAYFARLLGLDFIAVVPETTAESKLDEIRFWGGKVELVPAKEMYSHAEALAKQLNGHYMDQFTFAERATDWRGNNNIAESIFKQMALERYPVPRYVVMSAGTGGTSATIGRYIRYSSYGEDNETTQLIVADPENSVFYDYYHSGDSSLTSETGSRIEGIGRPRVEASFMASIIDQMTRVSDVDSLATIHFLERYLGKRVGASTGTNMYAVFEVIERMIVSGESGSIVTLICDAGNRYTNTYYDQVWLAENGFDLAPSINKLEHFMRSGKLC